MKNFIRKNVVATSIFGIVALVALVIVLLPHFLAPNVKKFQDFMQDNDIKAVVVQKFHESPVPLYPSYNSSTVYLVRQEGRPSKLFDFLFSRYYDIFSSTMNNRRRNPRSYRVFLSPDNSFISYYDSRDVGKGMHTRVHDLDEELSIKSSPFFLELKKRPFSLRIGSGHPDHVEYDLDTFSMAGFPHPTAAPPAISPDGEWLAYNWLSMGAEDIFLELIKINKESDLDRLRSLDNERVVISEGREGYVLWLSDSKLLITDQEYQDLHVYELQTGELTKVFSAQEPGTYKGIVDAVITDEGISLVYVIDGKTYAQNIQSGNAQEVEIFTDNRVKVIGLIP